MEFFEGVPELPGVGVELADITDVAGMNGLGNHQAHREVILSISNLGLAKISLLLVGIKEVEDAGRAEVNIKDPASLEVVEVGTWRLELFNGTDLKGWMARDLGCRSNARYFWVDFRLQWLALCHDLDQGDFCRKKML
jgi:hypothetical protein